MADDDVAANDAQIADALARLPESGAEAAPRRRGGGGGASRSAFEQTMTRPRAFEAQSTFFGAQRTYTRQRLYRRDDSDLRADAHDEPLDRVRAGYSVPLRDLDEDPYAEAGHVGVFERREAIEQFRSDARSEHFRRLVRANRGDVPVEPMSAVAAESVAHTHSTLRSMQEMADARRRQARTRAEIIRVMERQEQQRTLFTVNYAGCVPAEYVDEFLSTIEAKSVCDALVPMLLRLEHAMPTHLEEGQLVRTMYNVGCILERADTLDVAGHVRDHVAAFDDPIDRAWYSSEAIVADEHSHCVDGRTRIRQLTFQIPTSAADAEGAQLREVSDAAGYRVKVVTHLVEATADAEREAFNVLCFRSFHFTRYF